MATRKYGPTKFGGVAELHYSHYTTGDDTTERIALYGVDISDGARLHTCTVNFPELPVKPGHVWIKDWSENQGVLNALVGAQIGMVTGRTHSAGHVTAHELKLHGVVYAEAKRHIAREVNKPARRGKKSPSR